MNNTKQNFKRSKTILQFLNGSKLFFVIALITSILNTVFNSLTPQVIRITIDSILGDKPFELPDFLMNFINSFESSGQIKTNLIIVAIVILIISIFSGISTFLCRVYTSKGSEQFIKKMRDRLFDHIQKLPYIWHVKHQTGDIIQRCTSDVEVIKNFVASQLLEIFRIVFLIIFALTIMFSMNVKMSLIALSFIPVVVAYSGIFFGKMSKRFLVADEAEGSLSATVQENLTGVRVVRAFGREKFEIERFNKKNEDFSNRWIKLGYVIGAYWGIGDLITGLQIVVIMVVGTLEAINGTITLGEFVAFVSYNATLVWPIRGLGRILSEMSKANVSIDRINYILNSEEESDKENAIESDMNKDIVFKNINFNYEGLKPILTDINFTIKAGSTFAILGGTGSGKSTLMHLLNRLYDLPEDCGSIEIGGININDMKRSFVRKNIGMVLQEPFLFSRTIQQNISAFRPEASINDIKHVASIACVDEAITQFTNGYETIVGEKGVTLSGGQKQRVAIARMLMQEAPIMVFDDSLSAVDSETDSKIRTALKEHLGKSTVILISHRITTLMQADMILVLEDGKIEEMGTHQELLAKEGIYKSIYDIQMSNDDRLITEGRDA